MRGVKARRNRRFMVVGFSTGRASGWTMVFCDLSVGASTVCHSGRTSMSGIGLRIEAVARAAHGDEVARLFGIGLEAFAELADEVVDRTHRARGLTPDQIEELRAREDLAWVAKGEQRPGERRG